MTEDTIRTYALQHDLVDVKVCAVNEVWSGLKLVGAFQLPQTIFYLRFKNSGYYFPSREGR